MLRHLLSRPQPICLTTAALLMLSACGGDKDPAPTVDYSKLRTPQASGASLTSVTDAQLTEYVKNGIRLQLKAGRNYGYTDRAWELLGAPGAPVPDAGAPEDGGTGGGGNFTETNVHVEGVDEADWAKYDGDHWFVMVQPRYDQTRYESPTLEVIATDPASGTADFVGQFTFDTDWGSVDDFYLLEHNQATSHLATLRREYGNVPWVMPGWGMAPEPAMMVDMVSDVWVMPQPVNGRTQVQMVDVASPSDPQGAWSATLDGTLVDSRRIGDRLYLVTRFDPWLDELQFEDAREGAREANEDLLARAEAGDLLPGIEINGKQQLLAEDCWMQNDLKPEYGLSTLVHVTVIDLIGQQLLASECLNSRLEVLTMTGNSLYLTGGYTDNQNATQATSIHKFALTEAGLEYRATGSVPGSLGWDADPVFRMDESGSDFRIVTSLWDSNGVSHHLSILEERNGELVTVAKLPNAERPAAIGKPGELVRSVRFDEDTAYIVTFQQTDPLYKIDLTDRLDPKIAGELAITGFASYMHPIGEGYVFSVGHEANNEGWLTGLKVELIDVSGNDPVVVEKMILGGRGSASEATTNLHALAILEDDDQVRIALPVTIHGQDVSLDYEPWRWSGLQLLEINGISTPEASMVDAGRIVADEPDAENQYPRNNRQRGILHDDAIFYTLGGALWMGFWDAPENALGPVTGAD